jgi:aryl-alcohol dehydrogenase-like predicted oxidoreductase
VSLDQLRRARELTPIVSVQNRYNLTERADEDVLEECEREGIAFIPWFPLSTGKLASGEGALAQIAERHHGTPAQVALAWLLHRSWVMLPIPGTASVKHLEENVGAARIELSDEDAQELEELAPEAASQRQPRTRNR